MTVHEVTGRKEEMVRSVQEGGPELTRAVYIAERHRRYWRSGITIIKAQFRRQLSPYRSLVMAYAERFDQLIKGCICVMRWAVDTHSAMLSLAVTLATGLSFGRSSFLFNNGLAN